VLVDKHDNFPDTLDRIGFIWSGKKYESFALQTVLASISQNVPTEVTIITNVENFVELHPIENQHLKVLYKPGNFLQNSPIFQEEIGLAEIQDFSLIILGADRKSKVLLLLKSRLKYQDIYRSDLILSSSVPVLLLYGPCVVKEHTHIAV
jgi:hypothetical protein